MDDPLDHSSGTELSVVYVWRNLCHHSSGTEPIVVYRWRNICHISSGTWSISSTAPTLNFVLKIFIIIIWAHDSERHLVCHFEDGTKRDLMPDWSSIWLYALKKFTHVGFECKQMNSEIFEKSRVLIVCCIISNLIVCLIFLTTA